MAEQQNWRWCHKCDGLFYYGTPIVSACPAGGAHDVTGSGRYKLFVDASPHGGATQSGWRFCFTCQGLYYYGGQSSGRCAAHPAGHAPKSASYVLAVNSLPVASQAGWRWCSRCQGLFYGGNKGGVCPAGGAHTSTGSGNYVLATETGDSTQIEQARFWIVSALRSKPALADSCVLGTYDGTVPYDVVGEPALRLYGSGNPWLLRWTSYPTAFYLLRSHPRTPNDWTNSLIFLGRRRDKSGDGSFYLGPSVMADYAQMEVDPTGADWVGWVAINNRDHNLVVDVKYGDDNVVDNTIVINWPWNGGVNQRWTFVPA